VARSGRAPKISPPGVTRFETYEPFISLIFNIFFGGGEGGRGKPRIVDQWMRGHDCIYNLRVTYTPTPPPKKRKFWVLE
jgi:hypothetical protein